MKSQKVDGLLIDLRDNGGGSLTEAIELTGLFIDQGPVVQVKDSRRSVQVESDTVPGTSWDGPLAVLVNRSSASASEIFAAAIQDYGRGLIIGEPTFGKGTVQNLIDLDLFARGEEPGLGQLKMTIAQFFRVDGGSTQHKGVTPDVIVNETFEDLAAKRDPQLQRAVDEAKKLVVAAAATEPSRGTPPGGGTPGSSGSR